MFKYKHIAALAVISAAAMAGFLTAGIYLSKGNGTAFAADGYILYTEEREQGGLTPEPLYFASGTRYQNKYPGSMVFKDIRGQQCAVDSYSFAHYGDESISAMSDGVLVNMEDINMGVINHYGVKAKTVLTNDGNAYRVENNGNDLSFQNFVWKLNNGNYLINSDNMTLTLPSGAAETIDGYLEVNYLEDGVVYLSNMTDAWQTVSMGTVIRLSNGVTIDLESRIIKNQAGDNKMTLGEILLDADENIQVQSAQDWVAPEFDFTTIDGEEGAEGETGEAGENGEAGQSGGTGEAGDVGIVGDDGEAGGTGVEGPDGRAGSAGGNGADAKSGNKGENGADGVLTDKTTEAQATMSLDTFELTAGSLNAEFHIVDEDTVLTEETGYIRIYDLSTGSMVEIENIANDEALDLTTNDNWEISCKNLSPNKEYRLVVTCDYVLKGITGTRDYINRTFYTDETGLQLEKTYATDNGFQMTLSKKSFSQATGAVIKILDGKGETVGSCEVDDFGSGNEVVLGTSEEMEADLNFGITLNSNTSYKIQAEAKFDGMDNQASGNIQTWKTLKIAPTVGTPEVFANTASYFDMSLPEVKDSDSAVTGYRYRIYRYESGGARTLVEVMESDKQKNVPLYLGETSYTNEDGTHNIIERKVNYQLEVIVTYYDNEKNAEVISAVSDSFQMSDNGDISVYYTQDGTVEHVAELTGVLTIDPKNTAGIEISVQYPLSVMIESSGNYSKTLSISETTDYTVTDNLINIPISLNGLKQNTSYRFSVWGYLKDSASTESYTRRMLGDYVTSTKGRNNLNISVVKNPINSAIGAYVYLGEAGAVPDSTANSITAVEMKLYTGSSASEKNLVGTYTMQDTNTNMYESSITDAYYGNMGQADAEQIYVDEFTFGKTTADMTASVYYLEIAAIYDYTYHHIYPDNENLSSYKNLIPLTGTTGVAIQVDEKVPDLPTPQNQAVDATPILNGEIASYGLGISPDPNLEDDTIVGYQLQGNYDNSGDLARTISYYVTDQALINEYKASTDPNKGADITLWENGKGTYLQYTLRVPPGASEMPVLNILFMDPKDAVTADHTGLLDTEKAGIKGVEDGILKKDQMTTVFTGSRDDSMGRGKSYVFIYKARLEFQGNAEYSYPNDYKGRFVYGQTLLTSPVQATPKQEVQADLFLYQTSTTSGEHAVWKYQYTDVDGAAAVDFSKLSSAEDVKKVLDAAEATSANLSILGNITDSHLKEDSEGYRKLPIRMTGDREYSIYVLQTLYDAGDVMNEEGEATDTQQKIQTATHNYVVPASEGGDIPFELEVHLEAPTEGSGENTVKFFFNAGNRDEWLDRIQYIRIKGTNVKTKDTYTQTLYALQEAAAGGVYGAFDMSRLGKSGDTLTFEVTVNYDTGEAGSYYLEEDPDGQFAVKDLVTGLYFKWYYGTPNSNPTMNYGEKAGYSSYTVTEEAPTEDISGNLPDIQWKILNAINKGWTPGMTDYNFTLRLMRSGAGWYESTIRRYPTVSRLADYTPELENNSVTIGTLTPSIYNFNTEIGLTTAEGNLGTASYNLIADTVPEGMESGRYIQLDFYPALDQEGNSYDETPDQTVYLKIKDSDTGDYYDWAADGLKTGWKYKAEASAYIPDESGTLELLLLNDTSSHSGSGKKAQYYFTTMDQMKIEIIGLSEITYNSYLDKTMILEYTLPILKGFDITYRLEERKEDGSYVECATAEEMMEAMGYTYDTEKEGWYKNNIRWTYMSTMKETINLTPGGIFHPDKTYRISVVATDNAGEEVNNTEDSSVLFVWNALKRSNFYIETRPYSSGNATAGMQVYFTAIDENRVIVDGQYLFTLTKQGETEAVFTSDIYTVSADVMSRTVAGLEPNTTYELRFYAVTDMENVNEAVALTKDNFQAMTEEQREVIKIYESFETTLSDWGGKIDRVRLDFNASYDIKMTLYNAVNPDLISSIEYSAVTIVDGKAVTYSGTKTRGSSDTSLFTATGTSGSTYYTNLPVGAVTAGDYTVTYNFKVGDTVIYSNTDALSRD